MKKHAKLYLSMFLAILLLSACGGVSQEEYDKVVLERDALQALVDAQSSTPASNNTAEEVAPTSTPDTQNSTAPGPQRIGLNETVSSSKLNITFLSCVTTKRVNKSSISYYQADEGMQYAIMPFKLENISQEDITIWPHSDFEYYADNVLYDSTGFGYTPPRIDGHAAIDSDDVLKPGRVMEGYVACEIPTDTKLLEIEYEGFIFEYDLSANS